MRLIIILKIFRLLDRFMPMVLVMRVGFMLNTITGSNVELRLEVS